MNRIENNNVVRMNKNMVEYTDTGEVRLTITLRDRERRNGDLWAYLTDFGLAGTLEKQILEMLDKNTEGYRRFKRLNTEGRWTKECENFEPMRLYYYVVAVDKEGVANPCYIARNRTKAIKEAGKVYKGMDELQRRRYEIEVRAYDSLEDDSAYDVIEWVLK